MRVVRVSFDSKCVLTVRRAQRRLSRTSRRLKSQIPTTEKVSAPFPQVRRGRRRRRRAVLLSLCVTTVQLVAILRQSQGQRRSSRHHRVLRHSSVLSANLRAQDQERARQGGAPLPLEGERVENLWRGL